MEQSLSCVLLSSECSFQGGLGLLQLLYLDLS